MSFSRWGPTSDLYIFDHSSFNAVVCYGCLFTENGEEEPVENMFTSLSEMLAHVQRHRDAGHNVPPDLEDKLKERWVYFG